MSDVSLTLLKKQVHILGEDRDQWKSRALDAERRAERPGETVWPSPPAVRAGWDKPGVLRWPGIVVHRFSKGSLDLVQFIVWDMNRCQYVLKTWKPMFTVTNPI